MGGRAPHTVVFYTAHLFLVARVRALQRVERPEERSEAWSGEKSGVLLYIGAEGAEWESDSFGAETRFLTHESLDLRHLPQWRMSRLEEKAR